MADGLPEGMYAGYIGRIQAYFPDLPLERVELNQEGMVNDVLIINRQRVFRFPKTERAQHKLQDEGAMLALARRYVTLRLPAFDLLLPDMASYPFLPGDALLRGDILRLETRAQDALAETLATFLRQMHTIPAAALIAHAIPVSDTVRSADDWLQLYADVQHELFPWVGRHIQTWIQRLFAPLLRDAAFLAHTPTFINGDLGPYHLLYDQTTARLLGVIDFGMAGLGDPACDVACLLSNYGEGFVARLHPYYPELPTLLPRARFWAATLPLQWFLGGVRNGDLGWFGALLQMAFDILPVE